MPKTIGVWTLRAEAEAIGQLLSNKLGGKHFRTTHNSGDSSLDITIKDQFRLAYRSYNQWILVMTTGIAVRFLDGLIGDKHTDPAVVVLDEGCHHAISLLSGHEGGANDLAVKVANIVGATPVITTATECRKPLILGIGCRKGVTLEQIEKCVAKALVKRSLSEIRTLATIDLKENEGGLLEFCRSHDIPLRIFRQDDVASHHWVANPSDWVQQAIGLDGVCEPCALMVTPRSKLIVPKTTLDGVAVAIAEDLVTLA